MAKGYLTLTAGCPWQVDSSGVRQVTGSSRARPLGPACLLNTEVSLRSKRELIEKFIQENLPQIEDTDAIPNEFEKFRNEEQEKALKVLIQEENLAEAKTEKLIENYLFAERAPLWKEVLALRVEGRPSILKSKEIADRILNKILNFVETFVHEIAGN